MSSRNETESEPEQEEHPEQHASDCEQDEDNAEECKKPKNLKLENIFRTVLRSLLASFEHCLLTLFPCIPPSGRNESSGPEHMR
jgi:hypothetical protein